MTIPDIILLPPNRIWRTYPGGKTLDTLEGRETPTDSHFAEDWIASTTIAVNKGREAFKADGLSQVTINGTPVLLRQLMEANPLEILGEAHFKKYGANTQFLLKFLDSAIRLHIQAHPTIPFAKKHLNSNSGKTEAYVILGSREDVTDPYIYLGFQHPLSKEEFKQAVLAQDQEKMMSCFEKIPIQPGDVFIVPGGLPHAIGEGVFMIEIMEPTDLVVRLEFERGGYVLPESARFMDRGVNFAMDMIEFKPISTEDIKQQYFCKPVLLHKENAAEETRLVGSDKTPCFSVHKLTVNNVYKRKSTGFHVGIVTKGAGSIEAGTEKLTLKAGDKFLVPFKTNSITYTPSETMEVVLTFPPAEMD